MIDELQIRESSIPSPDKESKKEEQYLIKRAERKEQMESIGHRITIVLLIIVVGVLVVIGVLRFLHLVLPHSWQWLSPEDLSKIDDFFIHGTIGALVVEFLRGKISSKERQ